MPLHMLTRDHFAFLRRAPSPGSPIPLDSGAYWAGPTLLTGLCRQCLLGWADGAYWAGPTVLTGLGRQCLFIIITIIIFT